MGNESWLYSYDPEPKQQSSQWKSLQSPKCKKSPAGPECNKEHAHWFFDTKGIVHREFVPCNTHFEILEGKCATKKTRILAQPQLAPSS
jgi:hypothetical protein